MGTLSLQDTSLDMDVLDISQQLDLWKLLYSLFHLDIIMALCNKKPDNLFFPRLFLFNLLLQWLTCLAPTAVPYVQVLVFVFAYVFVFLGVCIFICMCLILYFIFIFFACCRCISPCDVVLAQRVCEWPHTLWLDPLITYWPRPQPVITYILQDDDNDDDKNDNEN